MRNNISPCARHLHGCLINTNKPSAHGAHAYPGKMHGIVRRTADMYEMSNE